MKLSALLSAMTALVLSSGDARAVTFEGTWPANDRTVSLDVDHRPASEALRQVADAAGLSLVTTLSQETMVTLHVHDVTPQQLIEAILGDASVGVRRSGNLVVVHPVSAILAPPVAAPALAPPPPPPVPAAHERLPDRVTFGGDIVIGAGERVHDIVTMGGDVVVNGEVTGDVVSMGGDLTVHRGGIVRGNVVSGGGDVQVDPGGYVDGHTAHAVVDIETPSGERAAAHHGHRTFLHWLRDKDGRDGPFAWIASLSGSALRFATLFLFALLLFAVVPSRFKNVQRAIAAHPGRAAGTGILGLFAAVALIIVLAISIIGIPAAIVVALAIPLSIYIGIAAMAGVIGALLPIPALRDRPIVQLASGVCVLFVLERLPVVGGLAMLIAGAIGLGAVVLTRFRADPADSTPSPVEAGPFRTANQG